MYFAKTEGFNPAAPSSASADHLARISGEIAQARLPGCQLRFELPPAIGTLLYNAYTTGILRFHPAVLNANIQLYSRFTDEQEFRAANGLRLELHPQTRADYYADVGALQIRSVYEAPTCTLSSADTLDRLVGCLNAGEYVYLHVDLFYIPETRVHGRFHWRHELLVVGITENGHFLCPTYDRRGEFIAIEVPAQNLVAAFCSPFAVAESFPYCRSYRIAAFKLVSETRHEVNPALMAGYMEDNLNGTNTAARRVVAPGVKPWLENPLIYRTGVFGIGFYTRLADFYEHWIVANKLPFDVRISRLILERTRLMAHRVSALERAGFVTDASAGQEWTKLGDVVWRWHMQMVTAAKARAVFDARLFRNAIGLLGDEDRRLSETLLSQLSGVAAH